MKTFDEMIVELQRLGREHERIARERAALKQAMIDELTSARTRLVICPHGAARLCSVWKPQPKWDEIRKVLDCDDLMHFAKFDRRSIHRHLVPRYGVVKSFSLFDGVERDVLKVQRSLEWGAVDLTRDLPSGIAAA